jgi:hypothetical protein
VGETVLVEGGENFGARARGDETGESEAGERLAEADMLRWVMVWPGGSRCEVAQRGFEMSKWDGSLRRVGDATKTRNKEREKREVQRATGSYTDV